jgi:hypothetical protein
MIRHIALFKWSGTEPDRGALQVRLAGVIEAVPGASSLQTGQGLGLSGGSSYDYAIVADFDSQASYLAYRNHAEHQALLRDVLVPASSDIAAIQFQVET